MPVEPRVTVSEAANLVDRVVLARAVKMDCDESQTAPAAVAERTRNSRRCISSRFQSCRVSHPVI
jgi:hypothetical protein